MNIRSVCGGMLVATTGFFSLVSSPADILINEVLVNPEGNPDNNAEFIELISTTGGVESTGGLTIVIADQNGGNIGDIRTIIPLNGFSTGENGLLLLGAGYTRTNPPENGQVPLETAIAAAPGLASIEGIDPNGGVGIFLVEGFSGGIGNDLDNNDDGILNTGAAGSLPFSAIVDSVGFRDIAGTGFNGINLFFVTESGDEESPDAIARTVGNQSPSTEGAWFGGERLGDSNDILDPNASFGLENSAITRGAPNAPVAPVSLLINEVVINPPGGDDNFEYIELINTAGGAASTQGHTLLILNTDDGIPGAVSAPALSLGVIVEAFNLDGLNTGDNSLLLLGDGYPDATPWGDFVDSLTALGDPSGLGDDNIGNEVGSGTDTFERTNDGFTLLLVKGFTGVLRQDLDTNDDGILDATPWSEIVDSIGYGELNTAQNGNVTATYALADISQTPATGGGFQPDAVSRLAGNSVANNVASWYGGDLGGSNSTSLAYVSGDIFGGFQGSSTPGRVNFSGIPTPAALVLSEVNADNPEDDGDIDTSAEFVEIRNPEGILAPLTGYTLLIVNTDNGNRGAVVRFFDISPLSTGPNGHLIFGDDFDARTIFAPGVIRAGTHVEDEPQGTPRELQAGDLPDGAGAILLVTNFTGDLTTDLDADDNGTVDAGIPMTIVDGYTVGQLDHPQIADLTQPGFFADNFSRIPQMDTPGDITAWTGGVISGGQFNGLNYSETDFFGAFRSGVTPGQVNHAGQPYDGDILLNELNVDPPVDDDSNFEYIELLSTNLSNRSLNGLSLVIIETDAGADDSGNTGDVIEVLDLDGFATGNNGLALFGDDYDDTTPAGGPYNNVVSSLTAVGDPDGLGSAELEPEDGLAFFLVRGSTAVPGTDLDELNDNAFDDGAPWTFVADAISFGFRDYGAPSVTLPIGEPDNISRASGNTAANDATAWYGGALVGSSGSSTTYGTAASNSFDNSGLLTGIGAATPGQLNLGVIASTDFEDPDGDGVANLLEIAMATDPNVSDPELFPTAFPQGAESVFSFRIASGSTGNSTTGFSVGGTSVVIELSTDLVIWNDATAADLGTQVTAPGAGFDQISVPIIEGSNPSRFFRLSAELE